MRSLARIIFFICALLVVQCVRAGEGSAQNWRDYHSEKWRFCAAFPEGWEAEELFGGELLKAVPRGTDGEQAVITLGAFVNQHGEGDGPSKPLEAVAEDGEDDLRDTMVKNLRASNAPGRIGGLPALTTRQSYIKGGEPFLAKEVRIARNDSIVIELILRAPDETFSTLEQGFDEMVRSRFQPTCTKFAKSGDNK